ncbi:MAG: hypothetical protein IH904_05095 [Proteobacteria bacterium]|nr:hypothetical protein [Pseudomonadota bacterium]
MAGTEPGARAVTVTLGPGESCVIHNPGAGELVIVADTCAPIEADEPPAGDTGLGRAPARRKRGVLAMFPAPAARSVDTRTDTQLNDNAKRLYAHLCSIKALGVMPTNFALSDVLDFASQTTVVLALKELIAKGWIKREHRHKYRKITLPLIAHAVLESATGRGHRTETFEMVVAYLRATGDEIKALNGRAKDHQGFIINGRLNATREDLLTRANIRRQKNRLPPFNLRLSHK